jgi:hypothetical protein
MLIGDDGSEHENKSAQEENQDHTGKDRLGKMLCRRKREYGRKQELPWEDRWTDFVAR